MPGRLVLGLPAGFSNEALRALLDRHGITLQRWLPRLGLALVSVPAGQEDFLAQALSAEPAVQFATRHRKSVSVADIPLDEYWGQQWGMVQVQGPAAWDLAWSDPAVVIAVIDTGILQSHWDLADRTWYNPGESALDPASGLRTCDTPVARNGVDDDDNGYIDDCRGYDFVVRDNDPRDENGHGTAVAGIAAATTNNLDPYLGTYEGVAGMARQASLMALRGLDRDGYGWPIDIAEAIDYAAANGAQIINLSLTLPVINPNPYDVEILRRAVEAAQAADVLLVAASGNQGYNGIAYPAAFPGVLAVGASTQSDTRASFSNYGQRLDLVAPGVGIFSTLAANPHSYGRYNSSGSGTSFAGPHVAGVAGLVRGLRPDLSQSVIYELLRRTADDVGEPGWDAQTGWGRLNAYRAAAEAAAGLALSLAAEPPTVAMAGRAVLHLQVMSPAPAGGPAGLGARIALAASSGIITPTLVTADSRGRANALYSADMLTGTVQITATLAGISTTIPLTVTSGWPASLALEAVPGRIASGGHQAVITATAWDEGGSAVPDGTEVAFTATLGTVNPLAATTVAGRATTTFTSGVVSGTAYITATAGAAMAVLPLEIVGAGEPFSITLIAEPAVIQVDGGPATVTATVCDGMGDPVADGTLVSFTADRGTVSPAQAVATDGQAITQLWPGTLPGQARVRAQAGQAFGETMVTILPGQAFTVTVTATPSELTVGYNQVARLDAQAVDRYGNSVADGTRLDFAASLGRVSPAWTTTSAGVGHVNLIGELIAGTSYITVTAAGGAQGHTQVRIRPAAPATLTLEAIPPQIAVGGEAARLRARARDQYGNAVADGTEVTFTTDLGALRLPQGSTRLAQRAEEVGEAGQGLSESGLVAQTIGGVAEAELVSGPTSGLAHVRASIASSLLATNTVAFLPGPPAALTLAVTPPQIRVGGRARLTATARDQYGNTVADGTPVRFASDRGALEQAEVPTSAGVATTWLTVRQGTGTVALAAISGNASAFAFVDVQPARHYLPLQLIK
jgi:hypothetical protein